METTICLNGKDTFVKAINLPDDNLIKLSLTRYLGPGGNEEEVSLSLMLSPETASEITGALDKLGIHP